MRDAVLVQVAVPSREQIPGYQELRGKVEQLVGRINGDYGEIGIAAVHYQRRNLPFDDLVALYRAADVMLVTPLADGMNLVAKEYVASRPDASGVLVLSEFAGAVDELRWALQVNPHDVDGLAETIDAGAPPARRARCAAACGRCSTRSRATPSTTGPIATSAALAGEHETPAQRRPCYKAVTTTTISPRPTALARLDRCSTTICASRSATTASIGASRPAIRCCASSIACTTACSGRAVFDYFRGGWSAHRLLRQLLRLRFGARRGAGDHPRLRQRLRTHHAVPGARASRASASPSPT